MQAGVWTCCRHLPLILGHLPACFHCTLPYSFITVSSQLNVRCPKEMYFVVVHRQIPTFLNKCLAFIWLSVNISQMNEEKNWFSGLLHLVTWIGRCIWAMCLGSDFETSTVCWPVPCFAVLGERSLPLDCSLDSRRQPAKHILCSTQD